MLWWLDIYSNIIDRFPFKLNHQIEINNVPYYKYSIYSGLKTQSESIADAESDFSYEICLEQKHLFATISHIYKQVPLVSIDNNTDIY